MQSIELIKCKEDLKDTEKKVILLGVQIKDLNKDITSYKEEIRAKDNQILLYKENKEHLINKCTTIENTKTQLEKEKEQYERDMKTIRKVTIKQLEAENVSLSNLLKEQAARIESMVSSSLIEANNINSLRDRLSTLNNENGKLIVILKEKSKEFTEILSDFECVKEIVNELYLTYNNYVSPYKELLHKCGSKAVERDSILEKLKQFKEILKLLGNNLKTLTKDKEEVVEKYNQLKSDVSKLEEKIKVKEAREGYLVETEAKLRLELSKELAKSAKCKEEWNTLQTEYKRLNDIKMAVLKEDKKELQYKLDILIKENTQLKDNLAEGKLRQQYAEAGKIMKREGKQYLMAIKEELKDKNEIHEKRHSKMSRELNKLRARIDSQEKPIAEKGLNYSFTARNDSEVSFMNKNVHTNNGKSFLAHYN